MGLPGMSNKVNDLSQQHLPGPALSPVLVTQVTLLMEANNDLSQPSTGVQRYNTLTEKEDSED